MSISTALDGIGRRARHVSSALAAMLLASALVVAPATPFQGRANAAGGCQRGAFCIYIDTNGSNYEGVFYGSGVANLKNNPRPGCQQATWNDCASSYWNQTGSNVANYRDINYNNGGGYDVIVYRGAYDPYLTSVGNYTDVGFNDQLSSFSVIGTPV